MSTSSSPVSTVNILGDPLDLFLEILDDESDSYEEKKNEIIKRITEKHGSTQRTKVHKKKKGKIYKTQRVQTGEKLKLEERKVRQELISLPPPTVNEIVSTMSMREDGVYKQLLFPTPRSLDFHADISCFPTAFANCLNSDNINGLSNLVQRYLSHECNIKMLVCEEYITVPSFVQFFELLTVIQPDRIMQVDATTHRRDHTQVSTVVHVKYTDCKQLYDAVVRHNNHSPTANAATKCAIMPPTREQYLRARMQLHKMPPSSERDQVSRLVDSGVDLVIQGSLQMHLVLDDSGNKATGLHISVTGWQSVSAVVE